MPNATYIALANLTLATATASVTLGSIPSSYRDLILVINGSVATAGSFFYRLNADSGANYSQVTAQGFGAPSSSSTTGVTSMRSWAPNNLVANVPFLSISQFMDYSATDKHKTVLHRIGGQAGGEAWVAMTANRWADTSAVTTILLEANVNLNVGTTFALYGIEA